MPTCAVYGCKNTHKNVKGTEVKLYTFPSNSDLAKQWLNECKRKDKVNISNAKICSVHFSEDSFFTPLQHKLLNYSPRSFRNLKPDAIPTLKLPLCKSTVQCIITQRQQRAKNKDRKSIVHTALHEHGNTDGTPTTTDSPLIIQPSYIVDEGLDVVNVSLKSQSCCSELEKKIKLLEEENAELKESMLKLQESNKAIELEKCTLYSKLKNLNLANDVESKVKNILGQIFSPGQIRVLMTRNRKIKWSSEDIACAISLRSVSTKAYRYLRNKLNYPLPSLSSLRRWVSTFECSQGILKQVLLIMEHNGKQLSEFQRIVALSFDEISLRQDICFDRKHETIFGPYSHAQVVMARGVTAKWKQPIYFDFDQPMTKSTLFNIIHAVEQTGFKVVSITSDLGGENRALWKELGLNKNNSSFPHPFDSSRKVFAFADVPHLLKLARNHFVDKGFIVCGNEHINKTCLEEVLKKQEADLKIAFKLSNEHLYVTNRNKQNVKLAAQLFSNSNASALKYYGEKGLLTSNNWKDTSEVLKLFNDWFDILNSSVPYSPHQEKTAFGININVQSKVLDEMNIFIEDMLVYGHKKILPFQDGIIISNKSLLGLFHYLKNTYNIEYLLTAKLNQDVLENFFSCIRSMGRTHDHPDALQFIYRMRWFIMGRYSSAMMSVKSNTAPDSEECFSSGGLCMEEVCQTSQLLGPLNEETDNTDSDLNDVYSVDEGLLITENIQELIHSESLRYVAGYVAFKLQDKYPTLGTATKLLPINDNVEFSWIETISKGGLRVPSDSFMKCANIVECCFNEFHGQADLRRDCDVIKKISKLVKIKFQDNGIPDEAISRLILIRTLIRMRHLNKTVHHKLDVEGRKWARKKQKLN